MSSCGSGEGSRQHCCYCWLISLYRSWHCCACVTCHRAPMCLFIIAWEGVCMCVWVDACHSVSICILKWCTSLCVILQCNVCVWVSEHVGISHHSLHVNVCMFVYGSGNMRFLCLQGTGCICAHCIYWISIIVLNGAPLMLVFVCMSGGSLTMQTRWWWLIRTSDVPGDKRLIMSWDRVGWEDCEEVYWLALLPKASVLGTSEGREEGWEISQTPPSLTDWLLWGPWGEQMAPACPHTQSHTLIQHFFPRSFSQSFTHTVYFTIGHTLHEICI